MSDSIEKDEEKGDFNVSSSSLNSDPSSARTAEDNEHLESFVVDWNPSAGSDPANPMNWSPTKKWSNILTISTISFLV